MERKLIKPLGRIIDFFLPSRCFSCFRVTENGAVICEDCYNSLATIGDKVCDNCGHSEKKCECGKIVFHYSKMVVPFKNEGAAKNGIYGLKFSGREVCADFFVKCMTERLMEREVDLDFDGVVYVPSKFIKTMERGYNTSKLLANGVADTLNIKMLRNVIKRCIDSEIQHENTSRNERFENAYKSYTCRKKVRGRILLVDDIKTTGATLEACSRALLIAGADEVVCLTALIGEK